MRAGKCAVRFVMPVRADADDNVYMLTPNTEAKRPPAEGVSDE